ncbi:MAG: hypothetical protein OXG35_33725 [Acidobacteria bacterium]|nr:hypothetical protein [Acidobacteriota bacterium]
MLAARWNHRESVDLDLTVNGGAAVPALSAGPGSEFEAEIGRRGGYAITFDRDRCTVQFSTGRLDLCALDPTPSEGHAEALVDGELAVVLTNAQILCGKLQRATRSPVRDVFDVVVAGKRDPHALAIAANTRSARDVEAIAAAWRTSNPVFADNAPLDLNGVGREFAGELTRLGLAAAAALAGACYERVRMYTARNVGFVETRTRNGTERKFTVECARIDEVFEANGLNHYLPQTGVRPVHIRERMRAACREGAAFVHDTAFSAKT